MDCSIAKTILLLNALIISPVDRDPDGEQDLEAAIPQVPDGRKNYEYPTNNIDWAKTILGFCLTAAIGLVFTPFQIPSGQLPLPLIFDFLGLSVLLAFTCILVSKCIHFSYCPAGISIARLFHYFGLFFGVTAIFISITIPFPSRFRFAAYSIYGAAFFIVLLCNIHFYKYYKPHGFKYLTTTNSVSKTVIDPAVESCRWGTGSVDDQVCTNRNEDESTYLS